MFGLGRIVSGFFESIGMGWMGSVMSLATNFMTGNWAAVAEDIFRLVSEFGNNSWESRVDRQQPLGRFGRTSCFGDNRLSEYRTNELSRRARDLDPNSERMGTWAIYIVNDTSHNNGVAAYNMLSCNNTTRI